MITRIRHTGALWLCTLVLVLTACGAESPTGGPETGPNTVGQVASIDVSPASGTVTVGATLQLSATPKDAEDNELGNRLVTWSSDNEGFASVSATGLVTGVAPGTVGIIATSEARSGRAQLGVAGASVAITSGPTGPRQGDVVVYTAETRDSQGAVLEDPTLTLSVVPSSAGLFAADGRFVGYTPGPAEIVAATSGPADTLKITIGARGLSGTFSVVGQGAVTERLTSDLWVYGDNAYTGTRACHSGTGLCGDRLLVWDISNPAVPVLTDSVVVDAFSVLDVKIRSDGAIAVITHQGGSRPNGITLLDLGDPAHPTVITDFTSGFEVAVHNMWVEGNHVYAVLPGFTAGGLRVGLRVIDISNPANPTEVAFVSIDGLHDVYVRDGLLFLSVIGRGALIIMDVGNGIAGGSPTNPVEVGRVQTAGGQTHNAWYWPTTGYVFVGEEDFGTPGRMHVIDASDLSNPVEVATFRVPGAPPHNFWLDENRAILFMAWFTEGVIALDVSGELLGVLEKQGRQIAKVLYDGSGICPIGTAGAGTCTWAPQLHNGLIYVSDMNSGLWVLRPSF